ncbi:hypothetical protein [Candidatus Phytoplasma solani]|uniref:hypothetical protein n=1 Tax=Candidatus Phytoplasma solani TaxID=69896 RepID=UPI0032DA3B77
MSTTELLTNNSKLSTELKQLNEIAKNSKIANCKRFQKITNLEESYFVAFNKISNNKRAGTSGIDGETIDGYTLKDIQHIRQLVRENKYIPKPVKYVEIPKSNGKTRPTWTTYHKR